MVVRSVAMEGGTGEAAAVRTPAVAVARPWPRAKRLRGTATMEPGRTAALESGGAAALQPGRAAAL